MYCSYLVLDSFVYYILHTQGQSHSSPPVNSINTITHTVLTLLLTAPTILLTVSTVLLEHLSFCQRYYSDKSRPINYVTYRFNIYGKWIATLICNYNPQDFHQCACILQIIYANNSISSQNNSTFTINVEIVSNRCDL